MTADLSGSCADLARWLPVAAALMAEPDADGAMVHGQPASRPPWNPSAAMAAMDAHEGLRRLEASWRILVNGHPGQRRGGSDDATAAAVKAVENLGYGLPVRHIEEYDTGGRLKPCRCPHCCSIRYIGRLIRPIEQLPAVDEAEPWCKRPGTCPYCGFAMLRVKVRAGEVTCLRYGACFDADGQHPKGTMEVGRLGPQVRWKDGLVAP